MATIIANGVFDLLHEGHKQFLKTAASLGIGENRIVVFVNTDLSPAVDKKRAVRGDKYPLHSLTERMNNLKSFLSSFALEEYLVEPFKSEKQLFDLIENLTPCIIVKGPDYINKKITGESIAPVLILDTPEPEEVKQMKLRVYSDNNPSQ